MVFQKVEYYGWNLLSVFLRGNLLGGVLWVEVPCFTHSGVEILDEFLTVGGIRRVELACCSLLRGNLATAASWVEVPCFTHAWVES